MEDVEFEGMIEWNFPESTYSRLCSVLLLYANLPKFKGNFNSADFWMRAFMQAAMGFGYTIYVQGFVLYSLWHSLPELGSSPVCTNDNTLQSAAAMVFAISLASGVQDWVKDVGLVLCSNGSLETPFHLKIAFLILLGVEVWSLIATLIVGIYYILIQDGASDIIQAAVAISFISDVDNQLYLIMPEMDVLSLFQGGDANKSENDEADEDETDDERNTRFAVQIGMQEVKLDGDEKCKDENLELIEHNKKTLQDIIIIRWHGKVAEHLVMHIPLTFCGLFGILVCYSMRGYTCGVQLPPFKSAF